MKTKILLALSTARNLPVAGLHWLNRVLIIGSFISAAVAAVAASNSSKQFMSATPAPERVLPSIGTLLDRYAESQKVFRSFILTFEMSSRTTGVWNGARHTTDHGEAVEIRYDGRRAKLIRKQWGHVDAALPSLAKEKAQPQFWMWDGQTYSTYSPNYLPGRPPKLEQTLGMSEAQGHRQLHFVYEQNIISYRSLHIPCDQRHDTDSIDKALRRANRISLRPDRENVGGSQCYVIEATLDSVKHGQLVDKSFGGDSRMDGERVAAAQHTLWLDPDHGYHIAKAVSVYAKPLGKGTFLRRDTRENVRFAQRDGVWLPVEMDLTAEEQGTSNPNKVTAHYKVTLFTRNPDFEARGSFRPSEVANDALVIVFEKGMEVRRGRWKDGQVAP